MKAKTASACAMSSCPISLHCRISSPAKRYSMLFARLGSSEAPLLPARSVKRGNYPIRSIICRKYLRDSQPFVNSHGNKAINAMLREHGTGIEGR
jgi:hypothetical protein